MEAIANYTFNPTEPDELGFQKGSTLYIIGMEEDPNWYRARQGPNEGMIPANYITIFPNPWYIPNCSRREAEARLLEIDKQTKRYLHSDGCFILRQSENDPGQFSISVKDGSSVLHFRIFFDLDGKCYIWTTNFNSINELIDYHRHQTIYSVKTLLLKDCAPSKTFGPVGSGHGANFDNKSPFKPQNNNPSSTSSSQKCVHEIENTNNFTNPSVLPPEVVPTSMSGRICMAKFDFNTEFKQELSFQRGHKFRILGEEDSNWWYAELIDSTVDEQLRGLIPANYVDLLPVNCSNS